MKIVAISDVHEQCAGLEMPDGDLLIIAGDLCERRDESFARAEAWVSWVRSRYDRVIYAPGNHDWPIMQRPRKYQKLAPTLLSAIVTDETVQIGRLKLHAMPWDFGDRDEPESLIPENDDILVTHEPPAGILDWSPRARDDRLGNRTLRRRVEAVAPRLHLFGHCHIAFGVETHGPTTFVNVAVCGDPKKYYRRAHPATIVNIDTGSLTVTQ